MWPAAAPAAFRPTASVAPAASDAAFLATPLSSTPTGSLDCSQTTPARMKTLAIVPASLTLDDAATSPAPSVTISRAWAGPPRHATRSTPKARLSSVVGASPSGGTRPLAIEITGVRAGSPVACRLPITCESPREGTPRKDVVGTREPGRRRLHAQLARKDHVGQVAAVLAVVLELG